MSSELKNRLANLLKRIESGFFSTNYILSETTLKTNTIFEANLIVNVHVYFEGMIILAWTKLIASSTFGVNLLFLIQNETQQMITLGLN